MATKQTKIDGILNINKPSGMTSHDVVARLRKLIGVRTGHAGTLDPLASGVLVVCLGKATRLAEYLTRHTKEYRAVAELGKTTDTYDAEGKVLKTAATNGVENAEVERALETFRGPIEQTPPVYSAVKHRGQPAHRLARRGVEVTLAPRRVVIHQLELLGWQDPFVEFRVVCSAGTYVRSLAHDLGATLGCGAHLSQLVREASGPFTLNLSTNLDTVEANFQSGDRSKVLDEIILPFDSCLDDFPSATLSSEELEAAINGRSLARPLIDDPAPDTLVRGMRADGRFVAILRFDPAKNLWRPHKVFATTAANGS